MKRSKPRMPESWKHASPSEASIPQAAASPNTAPAGRLQAWWQGSKKDVPCASSGLSPDMVSGLKPLRLPSKNRAVFRIFLKLSLVFFTDSADREESLVKSELAVHSLRASDHCEPQRQERREYAALAWPHQPHKAFRTLPGLSPFASLLSLFAFCCWDLWVPAATHEQNNGREGAAGM